jgi:hypothetical protein
MDRNSGIVRGLAPIRADLGAQTRPSSVNMACSPPMNTARRVAWLQGITLAWMLIECGVSFYGASIGHGVGKMLLAELISECRGKACHSMGYRYTVEDSIYVRPDWVEIEMHNKSPRHTPRALLQDMAARDPERPVFFSTLRTHSEVRSRRLPCSLRRTWNKSQ